MKVSVVIPAYNESGFIENCLSSLAEQTVKPLEILVIDNNSKDDTRAISESLGATVISESKQGIAPTRNAGFNAAKGDIIARCDADTIVPPDWVEQIIADFEADPSIIGITGPCFFYDWDALNKIKGVGQRLHTGLYFKTSKIFMGHEVLFGSNMAMRKSAWELISSEVCVDDSGMHEDMDLASHLSRHGVIKYDPLLVSSMSARRLKSPAAYTDYPLRWMKSVLHGKRMKGHEAKS